MGISSVQIALVAAGMRGSARDVSKVGRQNYANYGGEFINDAPNSFGIAVTRLSKDVRHYLNVIEQHTGLRVHKKQRGRLVADLRAKRYTRLSPEGGKTHRKSFSKKVKDDAIAEWEKQTGQAWPRYTDDLVNEKGAVLRGKGDPYDAHHIIENIYGGPASMVESNTSTLPRPTPRWHTPRRPRSHNENPLRVITMSIFDYLFRTRDVASLPKLTAAAQEKIRTSFPGIPEDYVDFLGRIGYGNLGELQIYSAPIEPRDVFPCASEQLEAIVLVGDDLQGYCFGFDTTESYQLVELDPAGDIDNRFAANFSSWIRDHLK